MYFLSLRDLSIRSSNYQQGTIGTRRYQDRRLCREVSVSEHAAFVCGLTSLAIRFRASSSAVDLSFLVDLFRPVPWVPMFPQSPRCKRAGGPAAQRIIQTDGAGAAVYRFSCVAGTDKNYRREAKNTNLEQPRSPLLPSIPLFFNFFLCFCQHVRLWCVYVQMHSLVASQRPLKSC